MIEAEQNEAPSTNKNGHSHIGDVISQHLIEVDTSDTSHQDTENFKEIKYAFYSEKFWEDFYL